MRRSDTPPNQSRERIDNDRTRPASRRQFLKLTGASAAALGGVGMGASAPVAAQNAGGPPNPDQWSPVLEDQFDGGQLDDSSWTVGWGWGRQSETSSAVIDPSNVTVQDNTLRLAGVHDGENISTAGVHTRGNVEFGPGTYVEARLKFPNRIGFHPAFWAQPTSNAWPPELDVVEVTQDGSGRDDTHTSRHFVHYSASTEPGDDSTHQRVSQFYEPGDDLTQNYHVYGAEWQSDRIAYYVDGQEIASWTDSTLLESFRKGAPFYLKLTMNINVSSELNEYLGQVDLSEQWSETFDADWVRVWEQ